MKKFAVVLLMAIGLSTLSFSCSKSVFKGDNEENPPKPKDQETTTDVIVDEPNIIVPVAEDDIESEPELEPVVLPPTEPPVPPVKIKEDCSNGVAHFKSTKQTVVFEETKSCRFITDESKREPGNFNIAPKEGFLNASETQSIDLNLPKGMICDMTIKSPETNLRYDDFLILAIDTSMLFMTHKGMTQYLSKNDNIFDWDFKKVVGKPIGKFETDKYCLASEANCVLPPHDTPGVVNLNFTSQEIAPIASSLSGKTKASINLTATGDNDEGQYNNKIDCFHSRLELEVEIKYLPN